MACSFMVFAMVVIGGLTRLTGSGLSMVDWEPIMSWLPPLDEAEWQASFDLYRQSPEFRKLNFTMDLAGYQGIFWLEYIHRLVGRLTGFVFLAPFLLFLVTGRLNRALIPRLGAIFLLGGLQGLLGWYMVKSGLVDDPHVSQYRLTAHLGTAFLIHAALWWTALGLLFDSRDTPPRGESAALHGPALGVTLLASITVLSGGLVAGLRAGQAYNTFPLMGGRWIPEGVWLPDLGWRNLFENVPTVQWDHRLLATLTVSSVLLLWWRGRRLMVPSRVRLGLDLLLAMALVQVGLGISTLLLFVPTALASLHQAGAMLLLTIALFLNHQLRPNG